MDKLTELADFWSKKTGREINADSMQCDGCLSDSGRLSGYCSICGIRKCAAEKKLDNCAFCADYLCKQLSDFLKHAPKAEKNLKAIRNS
jgi:hypothetical protein